MYKKRRNGNYRPHGRNNRRYSKRRNFGGRKRINIFDPRDLVKNNLQKVDSEVYEVKNEFSDFKIDKELKKAIARRKYIKPTPIQDQVIPEIIKGKDIVGIANTGTGKTAAFLIPLLNKTHKEKNQRVLIVAPTRELAVQIEEELKSFNFDKSIRSVICIGGVSIKPQIDKLIQRPSFVIGTPGRLLDLNQQGRLDFTKFNNVVLDEVDRMLDMGFINDIKKIINKLPSKRQSLFFSATLDRRTTSVMGQFLRNPVVVSVKTQETAVNIEQEIIEINGKRKSDILCEVLNKREVSKALVFVRTKRGADSLCRTLRKEGFNVEVMHGNKSQNQRQRSLESLRNGRTEALIATDVASRGIDVDDITHVINYDLPETKEDYIHRIGRTGRRNKKGVAISFVN